MGQKHKQRAEKHLKAARKTGLKDELFPALEAEVALAEAVLAVNHTLRKWMKREFKGDIELSDGLLIIDEMASRLSGAGDGKDDTRPWSTGRTASPAGWIEYPPYDGDQYAGDHDIPGQALHPPAPRPEAGFDAEAETDG